MCTAFDVSVCMCLYGGGGPAMQMPSYYFLQQSFSGGLTLHQRVVPWTQRAIAAPLINSRCNNNLFWFCLSKVNLVDAGSRRICVGYE